MRVLFLGGTAFTGPYAVLELVDRGHDVTVFHRGDSEPELPAAVRHVHGDVAHFEDYVDELRALRPDVVVDMLAFVPEHSRRLLAFKGVARRGVVVSIADVYRAYGWVRGYAEDVGHALALAVELEQAAGRIYNVAAPVAYTEAEWVQRIADVVGWEGRVVVARAELLPESMRPTADFTQHYDVDSSRIRNELGYTELVDERTALERTVAWERASPPADTSLDYAAEDAALAALTP